MKKEEHNIVNFGAKHNFICIFRILYISYFVYFAFCNFRILHFSVFLFKLHLIINCTMLLIL